MLWLVPFLSWGPEGMKGEVCTGLLSGCPELKCCASHGCAASQNTQATSRVLCSKTEPEHILGPFSSAFRRSDTTVTNSDETGEVPRKL